MDGMHDLGGRQGFGPVRHSPTAPAFHESWEERANALYSLAVRLGVFNMDEYRHAIERMEPRHYLSASYYERTLTSLATLCVEKGVCTREELEALAGGAFPLSLASAPGRSNRPGRERFAIGDRIRARRSRARPRAPARLYARQDRRRRRRVAALPFPRRARPRRRRRGRADLRRALQRCRALARLGRRRVVHVGVFESYLERAE